MLYFTYACYIFRNFSYATTCYVLFRATGMLLLCVQHKQRLRDSVTSNIEPIGKLKLINRIFFYKPS